jgi:hypothetical protein
MVILLLFERLGLMVLDGYLTVLLDYVCQNQINVDNLPRRCVELCLSLMGSCVGGIDLSKSWFPTRDIYFTKQVETEFFVSKFIR